MSRWTAPLGALVDRLTLPAGSRRELARIVDQSPVPLSNTRGMSRDSLFGDRTASAGFLTYLTTYGDDAVVHPIVARLAEDTAAAPWGLWTKAASGDKADRMPVRRHGVLDLIEHPNDFQTFGQIVEGGQQHFDLVGELDIVLGFATGIKAPLDMWLLRPDRIQPIPDRDRFLAGWVYISPDGGERIPLDVHELMRTMRPSPVDPYRGMGPIQALLRDLDSQRYTKEWQAAFFQNSARPGGVIQIDRHLTDDEFDELRTRWADQHKGVSKAHRVAVLEHDAKWIETGFSLREMQMAELENVSRDKTLLAFGMPKSMLGIVEDVNRANAEAGEYLYTMHMIRPRLNRWRAMLNKHLLPLFGKNTASTVELDYEDPVPENSEAELLELGTKATVLTTLVGAGYDSSEVLEMLRWPDLKREKPEPAVLPPGARPGQQPADPEQDPQQQDDVSRETSAHWNIDNVSFNVIDVGQQDWESSRIDAAMRWKVIGHPDASCCDPCMKNLGKLYRNRSEAWSDYPAGRSYIKCIGEKYGNHCRCRVIKRRDGR